jgi:hypothetical protein
MVKATSPPPLSPPPSPTVIAARSTAAAAPTATTFGVDIVGALPRQYTVQRSASEPGDRQRGDCRLGEPTTRNRLLIGVRIFDRRHEASFPFHSVSSISPGG